MRIQTVVIVVDFVIVVIPDGVRWVQKYATKPSETPNNPEAKRDEA